MAGAVQTTLPLAVSERRAPNGVTPGVPQKSASEFVRDINSLDALYAQAFTSTNPTTVLLAGPNPYGLPFQAMPTFTAVPPARYPDNRTTPGLLPVDEVPLKLQAALEMLEAVPMDIDDLAYRHTTELMKNLADPLPM